MLVAATLLAALEQDKGELPTNKAKLQNREDRRQEVTMSSSNEEDHPGELCYNGDKKDEWTQTVEALNKLHDVIYPNVLEKGIRGEWKRVHPDFPDVAGVAATELFPGYKAFEFVKKTSGQDKP